MDGTLCSLQSRKLNILVLKTLFYWFPLSINVYTAQLDIDDAMTAGSRTPFNTPPERRRENVFELGDILEALQSVGRRNSQPVRLLASF